jgi:hypothetical protein
LKTLTDSSEAGLNYLKYNLVMDSTSVPAYEKSLNDKKDAASLKIEKAEDGNYYLIPGKYTIEIEDPAGHAVSVSLNVVEKKNGSEGNGSSSSTEEERE